MSCPYRRDCPSGVWDASEYAKLPQYDGQITEQTNHGLFLCHQAGEGALEDADAELCAGWVMVHGFDTLALRMGVIVGYVDADALHAFLDHPPAVEVFATGEEAAIHGLRRVKDPDARARRLIDKFDNGR